MTNIVGNNNIRLFRVSPSSLVGLTPNQVRKKLKLNRVSEKEFDLEIEDGIVIRATPKDIK